MSAVAVERPAPTPEELYRLVYGSAPTSHFSPTTRYKVEFAWGQASGGVLTFGLSRFGGTDTFAASPWSGGFSGPYSDLSSRVRRIQIVRGVEDDLSTMRGGTATIDLADPDGLLNEKNAASPLAATLFTGIPVRISALLSDGLTWVGLYYGFVSTILSDPGGRYGTAQITATDLFGRLNRPNPVLGSLPGATTGSVVGAILDSMQWTDPAMRALDVGDALPSPYTRGDGTRSATSLVEELLIANRGLFYVSGLGAVTFKHRYAAYTGASLGTIDRVMKAMPVVLDESAIYNRWTVQRTDMADNPVGVSQVASVAPTDISYRRYGYVDNAVTSPCLVDDNQALYLAQYLVANTKSPVGRSWQIPIVPPDSATLDQILSREIGDRVTLTVKPDLWGPYTADYIVKQIQHDIQTQGTPRHMTSWRAVEAGTSGAFRFGISTFGGSDYLVY